MKLFIISLVAACALLVAMATSALATGTDSHFPEGVTPGQGCTTVVGTPANGSGSATGQGNKNALFADACAGGP